MCAGKVMAKRPARASSMHPGIESGSCVMRKTSVAIISVGAHPRTVTMSSLKPYLISSPEGASAFKKGMRFSRPNRVPMQPPRRVSRRSRPKRRDAAQTARLLAAFAGRVGGVPNWDGGLAAAATEGPRSGSRFGRRGPCQRVAIPVADLARGHQRHIVMANDIVERLFEVFDPV